MASLSKREVIYGCEPTNGTTLRIYLPHTSESQPEQVTDECDSIPLEGNETILLVEDEPSVRQLANQALSKQGYKVLTAPTVDEVLQLAEDYAGPIDLILTDVVMPRMGGRQVAEQVARLRSGIKILFMSGHTENAIVHQGVLQVGTEFLPKPFTPTGLVRKVRQLLDRP